MRINTGITGILAGLALVVASGASADLQTRLLESQAEYSATRVMSADGTMISGRYYHRPDRNRSETTVQGTSATMIMRMDREVAWTLMPGNMYMEIDLSEVDTQPTPEAGEVLDAERVGSEMVNGYPSEKWRMRVRSEDGSESNGHVWVTEGKDPIVIKMDMDVQAKGSKTSRLVMELQDLQIAAQPPSLFELPGDARPFSVGGVFSGILGGGVGSNPDAPPGGEPNIADEVADSALKGAKDGATSEVYRNVRDSVGGGVRKLFGK